MDINLQDESTTRSHKNVEQTCFLYFYYSESTLDGAYQSVIIIISEDMNIQRVSRISDYSFCTLFPKRRERLSIGAIFIELLSLYEGKKWINVYNQSLSSRPFSGFMMKISRGRKNIAHSRFQRWLLIFPAVRWCFFLSDWSLFRS